MNGAARRVDQWLSMLGYCSRKEARKWLRAGRVCRDGRPLARVEETVTAGGITVDGAPLDHPHGLYLLYHKPRGLICSHAESPSIYKDFPERWLRRNPPLQSVGRLDQDSEGLLLLTDDGPWLHRLISPDAHRPRIYGVELAEPLRGDEERVFAEGTLRLRGEQTPCRPAGFMALGPREARVTLREGRYHQLRRMFAAMGNHVVRLRREAIGDITLGDLPTGAWRDLTAEEREALREGS